MDSGYKVHFQAFYIPFVSNGMAGILEFYLMLSVISIYLVTVNMRFRGTDLLVKTATWTEQEKKRKQNKHKNKT